MRTNFHANTYAEYRGEIYHPLDQDQEAYLNYYDAAKKRATRSALCHLGSMFFPILGFGTSILLKKPQLFKWSLIGTSASWPLSIWSYEHNSRIADGYSRLFQIERRSFRKLNQAPPNARIIHFPK